jgi:hypothetical protein
LSLDEAKTLSQSPPAPAAGLFKERREKTMATCGRSLDEQRANATASHNLATAIYFFISAYGGEKIPQHISPINYIGL